MLDENSKPFTVYIIEHESGEWSRRYNEFRELYKQLKKEFVAPMANIKIKFPPKRIFGNLRAAVVNERKEQLQTFLNILNAIPKICESNTFNLFIGKPLTFTNVAQAYKVKYPCNWACITEKYDEKWLLFHPISYPLEYDNQHPVYIQLLTDVEKSYVTLEQYVDTILLPRNNQIMSSTQKELQRETRIGNIAGIEVQWTGAFHCYNKATKGNFTYHVKLYQIVTFINGKALTLSYRATQELFDEYFQVIQYVTDSLMFLIDDTQVIRETKPNDYEVSFEGNNYLYNHLVHKFRFLFPSAGWSIVNLDEHAIDDEDVKTDYLVKFSCHSKNPENLLFFYYFSVTMEIVQDKGLTLDEFTKQKMFQLPDQFSKYSGQEQKSTTVGSLEAHEITFEGAVKSDNLQQYFSMDSGHMKRRMFWFKSPINCNFYIINLSCSVAMFDDCSKEIQEVLNSFQFIS